MKTALAYIRVSTKKQKDKGLSLEAQEIALNNWAKINGYSIIRTFIDKGKTGTNTQRSEYKLLMAAVDEDKPDAIITYENDRLMRNLKEHTALRETLMEKGVKLIYATMEIDLSNPDGMFLDSMMAAIAQYKSDKIKRVTSDNMYQKAKAGWPPKEAPIGYKNVENPDTPSSNFDKKIVIPNPKTKNYIIQLFNMYSTGEYSYEYLAEMLNDKGIKPKRAKRCTARLIEHILKNPYYIGKFRWKEEIHQGKYEPLISQELFDHVQLVMAKRNHYACRKRKHDFLLRGILFYRKTQGLAYAEYHTNKQGVRSCWYSDSTRHRGTYILCDKLEKQVEKYMEKIQLSEEYVNEVMTQAKEVIHVNRSMVDSETKSLIASKTNIEHALRELEDDRFLRRTIDSDKYESIAVRYTNDLREIGQKLKKVDRDYNEKLNELSKFLKLAENIGKAYKEATLDEKRIYIGIFFEKLEVTEDKKLVFHLTPGIKDLIELGSIRISILWGGRRDSNPRHPPPQGGALPLNYGHHKT